ncbi:MAG: hypothetical protein HZC36_06175 [Armatimonadetes bacterium]|nr:hypothetical protein [Armatimonadota bacterium]
MVKQTPLPFAYSQREEFLSLPLEKRSPHLWEAYAFCTGQVGLGRIPDPELARNIGVLQTMMLEVARFIAARLRQDGTYANCADERWPRNHTGSDLAHYYDSGAYPPQLMTLPNDPTVRKQVLGEAPEQLFDEMIAWSETPAGKAGLGDAELRKLLSERDSHVPEDRRTEDLPPAAAEADRKMKEAKDQETGVNWLKDMGANGRLMGWAESLGLEAIVSLHSGAPFARMPMDRLLPKLMAIEASGDWDRLETFLRVELPADAANLAKLRGALPKSRK